MAWVDPRKVTERRIAEESVHVVEPVENVDFLTSASNIDIVGGEGNDVMFVDDNNDENSHLDANLIDNNEGESQHKMDRSYTSTRSYEKLSEHLDISSTSDSSHNKFSILGNQIIDMEILCNVISLLGCPDCHEKTLTVTEISKQGFAKLFQISCRCEWYHKFWTSPKMPGTRKSFDINKKRLVYAFRVIVLDKDWKVLRNFQLFLIYPNR